MTPASLRNSYLQFMAARGAVVIPSASLLPENDPTTLFTGAGMQPMMPYLLGEPHPAGNDLVNLQKCLRTGDIDEIGDTSHLTFFEMMGRWELGGDPNSYKQRQIEAIWEWQVKVLGLDPTRVYVSVYQGNQALGIPKDSVAIETWQRLFQASGIDATVEAAPYENGLSGGGRIFLYDEGENWWSRAGLPDNMPVGEPGGPDSEMFFDFEPDGDETDHPASESERFLEIGNNVFMTYRRTQDGFAALDAPNIDYGGGFERVAAAVSGDPDVYRTPFFDTARAKLSEVSGTSYESALKDHRIVLDHIRAATFLVSDGALPSNVDAGYVTRRLIRRAVRAARKLGISQPFVTELAAIYIDEADAYPEVADNKSDVLKALAKEELQFQKTLKFGERAIQKHFDRGDPISGADAFRFYETYGFPLELTQEFLAENGAEVVDPDGFKVAAEMHSRKSSEHPAGKFKGGLADHAEKTTALHTATHLMLAGLRDCLGTHVHQKGSNITPERARFDFEHDSKMSAEEISTVEEYVTQAIAADAIMTIEQVPKQQAMDEGIEGSFWEKYPDVVNVYTFKDSAGTVWSRELCGGPHVENTGKLGDFGVFKIEKEQSVGAGVRRIRASLVE